MGGPMREAFSCVQRVEACVCLSVPKVTAWFNKGICLERQPDFPCWNSKHHLLARPPGFANELTNVSPGGTEGWILLGGDESCSPLTKKRCLSQDEFAVPKSQLPALRLLLRFARKGEQRQSLPGCWSLNTPGEGVFLYTSTVFYC